MKQPPTHTHVSAEGASSLPLTLAQLPPVPGDRKEVIEDAARVTVRVPESQRMEAVQGLRQVQSRAAQHGPELGDLGPSPESCGAVADELEHLYLVSARLSALQSYVDARRAVGEQRASRLLREAYDEVTRRIDRGRIPAESYVAVRAFVESHGASISHGLARAAKVRAEMKSAAPANDVAAQAKTGTDGR